uniref:Galectin n=1 Tax=Parascaris univalens TaxID=6257 RepID=A0A914ZSY1_PARUN
MRYENGIGIRAFWERPGLYSVTYRIPSGCPNDSYFLSQPHRVRYGKVTQGLHVGQEFFLEIFIGDSQLYYWNREEQTAAIGSITFLDLNDIELLHVQIEWKKGVIKLTKPRDVHCGIFKYENNSIIQMVVRIERDEFKIEVESVLCSAQHEGDPNDIVAFMLSGNIEPLRYVVYDN